MTKEIGLLWDIHGVRGNFTSDELRKLEYSVIIQLSETSGSWILSLLFKASCWLKSYSWCVWLFVFFSTPCEVFETTWLIFTRFMKFTVICEPGRFNDVYILRFSRDVSWFFAGHVFAQLNPAQKAETVGSLVSMYQPHQIISLNHIISVISYWYRLHTGVSDYTIFFLIVQLFWT